MTIRVAFRLVKIRSWTGGVNYILNLCRVLREHAPQIEPVLFAPSGIDADLRNTIARAIDSQLIELRDRSHLDDAAALAGWGEVASTSAFRQARIDLVFESAGYYGPRPDLPILSWLPDFQHRRLPHFFSRTQWLAREIRYRSILAKRRHVLLSSQDAYSDMVQFYGPGQGMVHVAPFAIQMDHPPQYADGERVRLAHGLPDRFIFLPNQFWIHKNHQIVVEALALIAPDERPCIAASGLTDDPRSPGVLQRLTDRLEQCGALSSFRILGHLPYSDILALNSRADALLNPSLFEGWSTTVEEAKALGTPLVLSDLRVHREQVGEDAMFFDPADPRACAAALIAAGARPARGGEDVAAVTWRNQTSRKCFAHQLATAIEAAAGEML